MDAIGVKHWGFLNVISEPGEYSKLTFDTEFVTSILNGEEKIIALGGFVSSFLNKQGIAHFPLQHPSPLNRNLNCKEFEKRILEECKSFIEMA